MRFALITVLSAALISPLLVGCADTDKQVGTKSEQSTNPLTGNTTTTDTTTYQRPDGSTYNTTNQHTAPSH